MLLLEVWMSSILWLGRRMLWPEVWIIISGDNVTHGLGGGRAWKHLTQEEPPHSHQDHWPGSSTRDSFQIWATDAKPILTEISLSREICLCTLDYFLNNALDDGSEGELTRGQVEVMGPFSQCLSLLDGRWQSPASVWAQDEW